MATKFFIQHRSPDTTAKRCSNCNRSIMMYAGEVWQIVNHVITKLTVGQEEANLDIPCFILLKK